jgi:hypothetical protein
MGVGRRERRRIRMSMQSLVVRREVTQPNSGLKVVFWE